VTSIEEDETKTITFKYDPFGRRIEKRIEELEEGEVKVKTVSYAYDNEDIILITRTGSDDDDGDDDHGRKHKEAKSRVSRFVHGPGIDEPLAIEQKGKVYFYHADGLGSIVSLTDHKAKVKQSYEYTAFGEMKRHGGKVKQPYGYTGREWDKEIGLYFYRARYYDPTMGRFISKDPIGFNGGDVNVYRYVHNNPINFIDPTGLAWRDVPGGVATALREGLKGAVTATGRATEAMGITSGRVQAAAYTVSGAGLTTIGTITLPEGAPLIGLGVPLLAEGLVRTGAEALGGDTSTIPSWWTILGDIGEGMYDAYGGCSK